MIASSQKSPLGQNLVYELFESLGRAIVGGKYAESAFPTIAEVAADNRVSLSVAREALKMLTAKGLISARPKLGTYICLEASWNVFDGDILRWSLYKKPPLDRLRHFHQLRSLIEPEAAALTAILQDTSAIDAILDGLKNVKAADRGDVDATEAHVEFHAAILRGSMNPFFAQLEALVRAALLTAARFAIGERRSPLMLANHAHVVGAILDRDQAAARTEMSQLLLACACAD